jgi:hypothetical protein
VWRRRHIDVGASPRAADRGEVSSMVARHWPEKPLVWPLEAGRIQFRALFDGSLV